MATFGWSVKDGALFTKTPSLTISLDAVERAERGLHLRQEHDPAATGGLSAALQCHVVAKTAKDKASVLAEADLARYVEEVAAFDSGDVGSNRGCGLRKGDAEFGEAIVDVIRLAPSTRAPPNQPSRLTVNPAKL